MKALVFCTCILMCASFVLTKNLDTVYLDSDTLDRITHSCMVENNITPDDIFHKIEDLENEVYNQPEMQERRKKNGCFLTCLLTQFHTMEGTDINEEAIQELVTAVVGYQKDVQKDVEKKILHDCIQETKDVTPVCEKTFVTAVCFIKNAYKLTQETRQNQYKDNPEKYQEHQSS